jgi:hypothetical protein
MASERTVEASIASRFAGGRNWGSRRGTHGPEFFSNSSSISGERGEIDRCFLSGDWAPEHPLSQADNLESQRKGIKSQARVT